MTLKPIWTHLLPCPNQNETMSNCWNNLLPSFSFKRLSKSLYWRDEKKSHFKCQHIFPSFLIDHRYVRDCSKIFQPVFMLLFASNIITICVAMLSIQMELVENIWHFIKLKWNSKHLKVIVLFFTILIQGTFQFYWADYSNGFIDRDNDIIACVMRTGGSTKHWTWWFELFNQSIWLVFISIWCSKNATNGDVKCSANYWICMLWKLFM